MNCPICQKETVDRFRPFCSKRCADVDLGRWMTGSYAIPVEDEDVFSEETTPKSEEQERPH